MNLFNPQNPNKYQKLKDIITPYSSNFTRKRYGGTKDGSYVFLKELMDSAKIIYSYGVGPMPSWMTFDIECANNGKKIYLYDGSIDESPAKHENFIFKKEYLNKDNFSTHIKENGHEEEKDMTLKMDIECHEYEVIPNNIDLVYKHFNQISMEVHSLIEEVPHGWQIDELSLNTKKNMQAKILFFETLNKYYKIVHLHANNHGPIYGDFPDSLEITFLRNDYPVQGIDKNPCPLIGFDYPSYEGRRDYFLNWWIK